MSPTWFLLGEFGFPAGATGEDSAGKDLGFCPCLKSSAAPQPQLGRQVGVHWLDRTHSHHWSCCRALQHPWLPASFTLSQAFWDSKRKAVASSPSCPLGYGMKWGSEETRLITYHLPVQMLGLSLCQRFLTCLGGDVTTCFVRIVLFLSTLRLTFPSTAEEWDIRSSLHRLWGI